MLLVRVSFKRKFSCNIASVHDSFSRNILGEHPHENSEPHRIFLMGGGGVGGLA